MTKVGVVGSGKYKNKEFVIKTLERLIDKESTIIVSGHSPRNKTYKIKNGKEIIYYDNVDIWAEDWAFYNCRLPPIPYPPDTFSEDHFFERNKKVALDSFILLVFIPRGLYKSGAWNTVRHFIEKPTFERNNLIIYDEYGQKWVFYEYPEWVKNKINKRRLELGYERS